MRFSPRITAILQALLVTILWSTSWVLIKNNLSEVPPLTFAGLRYTLAFLVLLPGLLRYRAQVRALTMKDWLRLAALGVVFYTLTQGGQFATLNHLEAITFSLMLNASTLVVVAISIVSLKEYPSRLQWLGIGVFLIGVLLYFLPKSIPSGQWIGYALAAGTVLANALAAVMGRAVNRDGRISPYVVTVTSMGIGSLLLLGSGLAVQGLPPLRPATWGVIAWLAVVNTAIAFLLWNVSLRVLTAVESNIINNTMLVQIAVLAWIFLDERLDALGIIALALASAGVLIVNWKPRSSMVSSD
jgi:drug/metabolite transporter (DMT)-like permease